MSTSMVTGISANVCKKGRGRPKKLDAEMMAMMETLFIGAGL